MEGTASAFFFTARSVGLNNVVISLVEHTELNWAGRMAYLKAVTEKRATELYAMDLVWMLVNSKYTNFEAPMPSDLEIKRKTVDKRTSKKIKEDILKRLGA